jgi:hypothetical protein
VADNVRASLTAESFLILRVRFDAGATHTRYSIAKELPTGRAQAIEHICDKNAGVIRRNHSEFIHNVDQSNCSAPVLRQLDRCSKFPRAKFRSRRSAPEFFDT